MPLTELNHFFVRANDLTRSHRFYCQALGMQDMPRPDFPFPGHWLGVGGQVQVHMGPHGIERPELYYLGTTAESATRNSGVVDHIAFTATEPLRFVARFAELGIPVRRRWFAQAKLVQLFVADPDGLTIELNFFGLDEEPAWGEGSVDVGLLPRVT